MKIKCLRFECEVCSKLASIQVFYNKSGAIKYARAKHYFGKANGKPQFEYHQQSLQYIGKELSKLPKDKAEIGQAGQNTNIDPQKQNISSFLEVEPSAGFGPATITLPR
jgi:hypothetical protein